MKNLKIRVGGGIRTLVVLTLAFAISLSTGLSVFAVEDGQHVTLSSRTGSYEQDGMSFGVAHFYIEGNGDYIGTCAQYGKDNFPGGVTIYKASITSDAAKAMYYFGVVRGWQDYLGTEDSSQGGALQAIAHLLSGSLDQYLINEADHPNMYRQAHAEKDKAEAAMERFPQWQNVKVPAKFEFYYCKSDDPDAQNVYFWLRNPPQTSPIKLKKSSANPAITG